MSNRSLFLRHIAQTSPSPLGLEITDSSGAQLIDIHGKKYTDLICGIGPSLLGHNHPKIIEAIHQQTDRYLHTMVYGEYVLSPQAEMAELLVQQLPDQLDNVYFLSTGTEAVEAAMKLAKRATGRSEIISMYNAYHGSTQGSLSLLSDPYFRTPFEPLLPDVHHIRFNAIADLEKITTSTAAVITEVIQAEAGIIRSEAGYLNALQERCQETGTLLILDEVQTGFGRTGKMFGFQEVGIVPDILCLGKGIGGGMPLSAVVAHKELLSQFSHDPVLGHITTFGGHPLCCAAGLASLQYIIAEDILSRLDAKIQIIKSSLHHPKIKEVREGGFWFAIDLGDEKEVLRTVQRGLEKGIIVDWFLFNSESLRLAPPLTITEDELSEAMDHLLKALG